MRRFTDLYFALDATTRTGDKVEALAAYFRDVPARDGAWALAFLAGKRGRRPVSGPAMRAWAAAEAGHPEWLVGECHEVVGDLSETIALLLPEPIDPRDIPLHEVVERHIQPMAHMDDDEKRAHLVALWRALDAEQRFVFHKLISGAFRVGVQRRLLTRAIAEAAGLDQAVVAHRLAGTWKPTPERFRALMAGDDAHDDPARPYPFFLASQLDDEVGLFDARLGDIADWQAEWKWDGIRAQLIRRARQTIAWSRGEELLGDSFPELRAIGDALPDGTVLDGELLAWEDDRPLPFALLQRRLNRRRVEPTLFPDVPVVFMAYDLLEDEGRDLREAPIESRRAALERIIEAAGAEHLRISPVVEASTWEALAALREQSRKRGAEGLMLKRIGSTYAHGRTRGDWWKWKIDPFTIDAVMVAAQPGHGKRATLFTDYTFALWEGEELVTIAKAYSGLTDSEIDEVDAWIRRHTLARHGPVRAVEPELVFELAFEGVQESTRHKSGVALRFPRIARWRADKPAREADTVAHLRALRPELPQPEARR
ncbi:MAG: ATP-dependent DNA ligase [Phycisphaerales bacterium]